MLSLAASVRSSRARLWPSSADATETTDLLSDFRTASDAFASCGPARPAMASSGACGSCGLPAAPGGRQAAGAAHRAAPRGYGISTDA